VTDAIQDSVRILAREFLGIGCSVRGRTVEITVRPETENQIGPAPALAIVFAPTYVAAADETLRVFGHGDPTGVLDERCDRSTHAGRIQQATVRAPRAGAGDGIWYYALGGNVAASTTTNGKAASVDTVSFNALDSATGALANASWTATTALPDKRGFAASVTADAFNSLVAGNGNLYVLGGLDGTGAATNTVYYAESGAAGW